MGWRAKQKARGEERTPSLRYTVHVRLIVGTILPVGLLGGAIWAFAAETIVLPYNVYLEGLAKNAVGILTLAVGVAVHVRTVWPLAPRLRTSARLVLFVAVLIAVAMGVLSMYAVLTRPARIHPHRELPGATRVGEGGARGVDEAPRAHGPWESC